MKRNFRPKLKKQVDNTKKIQLFLKHEEDNLLDLFEMIIIRFVYDGKRWNSVDQLCLL